MALCCTCDGEKGGLHVDCLRISNLGTRKTTHTLYKNVGMSFPMAHTMVSGFAPQADVQHTCHSLRFGEALSDIRSTTPKDRESKAVHLQQTTAIAGLQDPLTYHKDQAITYIRIESTAEPHRLRSSIPSSLGVYRENHHRRSRRPRHPFSSSRTSGSTYPHPLESNLTQPYRRILPYSAVERGLPHSRLMILILGSRNA